MLLLHCRIKKQKPRKFKNRKSNKMFLTVQVSVCKFSTIRLPQFKIDFRLTALGMRAVKTKPNEISIIQL